MVAGRNSAENHGFVNPPVIHASTVLYPNAADMVAHRAPLYLWPARNADLGGAGRCPARPRRTRLRRRLRWCRPAPRRCRPPCSPSLKAGDHILITDSVYRPTRVFADSILKKLGVETTYYDPLIGAGIDKLMRPNTRAVFVEAPGSQSFEMQDIPAIAQVARAKNAIVLMDNTWATPLYFRAFEKGVDISIQAGTKYIGGHSDLMLGTISANAATHPQVKDTLNTLGLCVGPDDMYLALRGLRTLARAARASPEIGARNRALVRGASRGAEGDASGARKRSGSRDLETRLPRRVADCSASILKPAPEKAVHAFLNSLQLFGMGFSWGGYESLVILFDCSGYRTATQWAPGGAGLALPHRA